MQEKNTVEFAAQHPDEKDFGYELGSEYLYDHKEGHAFRNIVNHTDDYTGTGLFPEEVVEVNPLTGKEYRRGKAKTYTEPFERRDNYMLELVKDNMPDRKLKVLELGSGRGGLTRFMAKSLMEMDKLEKITALNISDKENEMNVERARAMGIPDSMFEVIKMNFDNLTFEKESFDLIFSNDAFMHSADQGKLCISCASLLKKDGIIVLSDIIEDPKVSKQDPRIIEIYKRYKLTNLGNRELYDESLKAGGMRKIVAFTDGGQQITRHFGMQMYSATVVNRDKILAADGAGQQFMDYKFTDLELWLELSDQCLIEEGFFCYKKR